MQDRFMTFMTSTAGRGIRLVGGAILAIAGIASGGLTGTIVALLALIPIASSLIDLCMAGKVLGYGLRGPEIRRKLSEQ